jgi:hypothetical protein
MSDWSFPYSEPAEELALLHHFSIKKRQPNGDVEFIITVYEYAHRNQQAMKFYAQADKQVNQRTAPFTPFGWGETLTAALSECIRELHQYPYEAEDAQPK